PPPAGRSSPCNDVPTAHPGATRESGSTAPGGTAKPTRPASQPGDRRKTARLHPASSTAACDSQIVYPPTRCTAPRAARAERPSPHAWTYYAKNRFTNPCPAHWAGVIFRVSHEELFAN